MTVEPAENENITTIAALEERLRLQELITDISALLSNASPQDVDEQIMRGLQRIAEFLDVDRCSFGEFSDDKNELHYVKSFVVPGIEPMPPILFSRSLPWYFKTLQLGKAFVLNRIDDLPEHAVEERAYCRQNGLKCQLTIPVTVAGSTTCVIGFASFRTCRTWPQTLIEQFVRVVEIFAHAMHRKHAYEKLVQSYLEIKQLKDRLQIESEYLLKEYNVIQTNFGIIGESDDIIHVIQQVEQVGPTDSSVLICGETGVGKELVAHAIHSKSARKDRVMIKINCASLPPTLVESELFGREKGAYTGAMSRQIGRFEIADGSTIFLDEISELSSELQAKLLQVLQDGTFERLGSSKTLKTNVRIIAATNSDLKQAIRDGKFRQDLFYRLNVFPIDVPPLRQRAADIPMLVWSFIEEFATKIGKKAPTVSKRTMDQLQRYPWPGNIRQLRNVIEHAIIINNGGALQVNLPDEDQEISSEKLNLAEVERLHITRVLELTQWRVKGPRGAAEMLGLKPSTLYSKMERLGISKQPKSNSF